MQDSLSTLISVTSSLERTFECIFIKEEIIQVKEMVEEQVVVLAVYNYTTLGLYTSFSKSSICWHTALEQLSVCARPFEKRETLRICSHYFEDSRRHLRPPL
jgi:hypothetical protein